MNMTSDHSGNRLALIRTASGRNSKALEKRPSLGRGTAVTRVPVDDGLRCEVEDGARKLTADMSAHAGGGDAGANRGVFGRTAFGTCLAMTYVMWTPRGHLPFAACGSPGGLRLAWLAGGRGGGFRLTS